MVRLLRGTLRGEPQQEALLELRVAGDALADALRGDGGAQQRGPQEAHTHVHKHVRAVPQRSDAPEEVDAEARDRQLRHALHAHTHVCTYASSKSGLGSLPGCRA